MNADPKCFVCGIPKVLALELTKTGDNRFLCEKCILTDTKTNTLRNKLAAAYERLQNQSKEIEKIKQFWE